MGRGKHQASLDLIRVAYEILKEMQPATTRGVCYKLFTPYGLIPDMSKNSTQKVGKQLVWARENDMIPWEWIVDEQRAVDRISSWQDPQSFMNAVKRSYRKDLWSSQKQYVEVWSEKGTVGGVLGPVLDEYAVTFRVMKGFSSATKVREACVESQHQPFTVLYVGDYDPSGMNMSESDLPSRIEKYGGEIEIIRIALVESDTPKLVGFPASDKRSDTRYQWFVDNYGDECWELDAMSPVDLRERVEDNIKDFIDEDSWDLARKAEAAEIDTIRMICANWNSISGLGSK
jgi:hypothetical protein